MTGDTRAVVAAVVASAGMAAARAEEREEAEAEAAAAAAAAPSEPKKPKKEKKEVRCGCCNRWFAGDRRVQISRVEDGRCALRGGRGVDAGTAGGDSGRRRASNVCVGASVQP